MNYEVNGIKYSYDSSKNQRIKEQLVGREVMCCLTSEIEYILAQTDYGNSDDAPFTRDDIEHESNKMCSECDIAGCFEETLTDELDDDQLENNLSYKDDDEPIQYTCPVCGIDWNTADEAKQCCNTKQIYICKDCGKIYNEDDYKNLDDDEDEIYEWWAVSSWLGDKLKKQGEAVIEGYCAWFWGRGSSGQAILLDAVISRIAEDMEILEGQTYEWDKEKQVS